MEDDSTTAYQVGIKDRINYIMDILGMEIPGFSQFTGVSNSHIYALSNGTKGLTIRTADKIAKRIGLTSAQLLKLDYVIPDSIRKSDSVNNFYDKYPDNPEYFKETKVSRKVSYFIEHKLMTTKLFDTRVSISQIREACIALGQDFSSKQLSQVVDYLALTKKLKKEKVLMRKKNGELGVREIPVYSKENDTSTI